MHRHFLLSHPTFDLLGPGKSVLLVNLPLFTLHDLLLSLVKGLPACRRCCASQVQVAMSSKEAATVAMCPDSQLACVLTQLLSFNQSITHFQHCAGCVQ